MNYNKDRNGSKWLFLLIFILVFYLAFFQFNVYAAYDYTVAQSQQFLQVVGINI